MESCCDSGVKYRCMECGRKSDYSPGDKLNKTEPLSSAGKTKPHRGAVTIDLVSASDSSNEGDRLLSRDLGHPLSPSLNRGNWGALSDFKSSDDEEDPRLLRVVGHEKTSPSQELTRSAFWTRATLMWYDTREKNRYFLHPQMINSMKPSRLSATCCCCWTRR
ncbi:hypothetical protein CEXT_582251 [Caerostris extrusa]|uniref:Uncharacterized protein n=1 Tax=Caerostris extrusa TaxID=172846 RepID=A0AAV4MCD8_CAEEX|nr:hypothetical protein CEXT_582251 [Caerostris extrusa]